MPAWHSGLTVKQSADLERVQRVALYIILSDVDTGKSEYNYDMSLVILDIEHCTLYENNCVLILPGRL